MDIGRSQLVLQAWKMILVFGLFYFWLYKKSIGLSDLMILILLGAGISLGLVFGSRVKVSWQGVLPINYHVLLKEGAYFLGITGSLTLLAVIDKVLLAKAISLEEIGNYNLYYTLLCSPFVFLQNVIGYSLMPRLRRAYVEGRTVTTGVSMREKIRTALGMAVLVVLVWLNCEIVIRYFFAGGYHLDQLSKLLLISIGIVRLFYAFSSADLGSTAQQKELILANLAGIMILSPAIFLLFYPQHISMHTVLWSVLLMWGLRSAAWSYLNKRKSSYGHPRS
jgi:O-antigen/teichoic acid export membrane protein